MKPPSAVERFASFRAKTLSDTLAANKQAMTDMGKITEGIYKTPNRQKVEAWLDSIGCTAIERDEVLDDCAENESARAYYLARANEEIGT